MIHRYIQKNLEIFGLGHTTACVYQFIGDDTEKKSNMLHSFFPGLVLYIEINIMLHIFLMDEP